MKHAENGLDLLVDHDEFSGGDADRGRLLPEHPARGLKRGAQTLRRCFEHRPILERLRRDDAPAVAGIFRLIRGCMRYGGKDVDRGPIAIGHFGVGVAQP